VDEQTLIEKLQKNDREAFNWLVTQYRPAVVRTCFGFLRDEEESRDVAQEVFLEVYSSLPRFRGDSKLSTWIFRIAVNRSLDQLRHHNRQKRMLQIGQMLRLSHSEEPERLPDTLTPQRTLENIERQNALNAALAKLPESQRIAFTLSNYDDLSYQQIAEVLDSSVSAVESLIHRAKTNLRKFLESYYLENKY
jgi:RNA polymerase sigma-70 factor, ECF subfamily